MSSEDIVNVNNIDLNFYTSLILFLVSNTFSSFRINFQHSSSVGFSEFKMATLITRILFDWLEN